MKISPINFNFNTPKVTCPTQNSPKMGLVADVFQKNTAAITFEGLTADKINNATRLNADKEPVLKRPDGGFLIDLATNTVAYYGEDAKNFLENTNYFPNETQIIAQSGCKIKVVDLNNKEYELNEPGAIVVGKATRANAEVIEGNPLVITCENPPQWYVPLASTGAHGDYFNTLVEKNREIFSDPKHAPNKLQNGGEVKSCNFENFVYQKLVDAGILKNDNGDVVWSKFYKRGELIEEMQNKTDLHPEEIQEIEEIWEQTTKSGFDITGLVDCGSSIAVYTHKDKLNQFNGNSTEWITNSSEWLPKGASTLGVSRVYNEGDCTRAFNEIREQERIHKHENPNNKDEKQVETYILTQGKAAAFVEDGDSEKIKLLNAGDMLVVPAGVKHGIIAASGDYEHLCIQTPSAFQYGFKFKSEQREFPPEMVDKAKNILDVVI